jgi:predicted Zn-dependent protease
VANYEKQVSFWGDKGGAPKKEYEQLTQEKIEIDVLYDQLNTQREALKSTLLALDAQRIEFNGLVSQVNTIAGIFNRLADKLNVRVNVYNEVQGSRDEFISGLYTSDAKGETIDVFQFYDNKDLVITLAHELGHALGLGHATGTNSIMFPKSEGQKIQLSKEDLQMLTASCN